MKIIFYILFVSFFINACQSTPPTNITRKVASDLTANEKLALEKNETLWKQYCSARGGANSTDVPKPNYENALVKNAVKNFETVAPQSFYLYPAILNVYGLKKGTTRAENSHNFLVYLCGEFRDRATLIEAKLQWLKNFNKLTPAASVDKSKINPDNIWSEMTAKQYVNYINITNTIWEQRQYQLEKMHKNVINIGEQHTNIDTPVPGMTVCETKYIFKNFLQPKKGLKSNEKDFAMYEAGLEQFKASAKNCSQADHEDYYDFRGDSNFKPNSPESNGMIWYTLMIANGCYNTTTAKLTKPGQPANPITNEMCADYFSHPFARRWNATKAGLATWLLHTPAHEKTFAQSNSSFIVLPHKLNAQKETLKPFAYSLGLKNFSDTEEDAELNPVGFNNMSRLNEFMISIDPNNHFFDNPDLGFNLAYESYKANPDANINSSVPQYKKEFIYARLRNAVNRHTDWYASGWDDGSGKDKSLKPQAYSPFVASSYEPSKSDSFTACGITVSCPPDGYRQWMFVFRIKGKNLYNTLNANNEDPLDFDRMWFDETSLGTVGLAKAERAWDRLGTALEDELKGGAILYLHHISGENPADVFQNDNLSYEEIQNKNNPTISAHSKLIAKRTLTNDDSSKYTCEIYNDEGKRLIKMSSGDNDEYAQIYPMKPENATYFSNIQASAALVQNNEKTYELTKKEFFANSKNSLLSKRLKGQKFYTLYGANNIELSILKLNDKKANFAFDKKLSLTIATKIDILCDKIHNPFP